MAAPKKTINLLPGDKLEKSPLGRFLKWALDFGRYIIVFTELLVMIAFFSRFKLDRDLAELQEEIKNKQNVIVASQELEKEVRFLQQRLDLIKKYQKQTGSSQLALNNFSQIIPLDVFLSRLDIDQTEVSFTGTSLSYAGLATFINGLQKSPVFERVDFTSVSSGGERDPSLEFKMAVGLTRKTEAREIQ